MRSTLKNSKEVFERFKFCEMNDILDRSQFFCQNTDVFNLHCKSNDTFLRGASWMKQRNIQSSYEIRIYIVAHPNKLLSSKLTLHGVNNTLCAFERLRFAILHPRPLQLSWKLIVYYSVIKNNLKGELSLPVLTIWLKRLQFLNLSIDVTDLDGCIIEALRQEKYMEPWRWCVARYE